MTAKRMRLLTAGLAIIALIAALFVINPGLGRSAAAAWDGTAAESFEGGNGDSSDPYIIKTAEQLAFLAKQVTAAKHIMESISSLRLTLTCQAASGLR